MVASPQRLGKMGAAFSVTSKLEIRIATEDDKDNLLKLCLNGNYLKEAYLINHYFERGGTGRRLVVGSLNDKIVGFSRIYDRKKTATKINMFIKTAHIGKYKLFINALIPSSRLENAL